MSKRNNIIDDYFEWLVDITSKNRYDDCISYRKLLMRLHDTEFYYFLDMDENRAEDGLSLRYRFAIDYGNVTVKSYLEGSCSVLEMMVALCIRCEEQIMDDAKLGDRTKQWFWNMIANLGLGSMYDDNFDKDYVDDALDIFLNREYEPNGKGGLFLVRDSEQDLRDVEIWVQMLWYLNTII